MATRMRLTKRSVEALNPAATDAFARDTNLAGFGVKITPNGRKTYVVQTRVSGRSRRYIIGRHGSPWTPENARKEALSILNSAAQGQEPEFVRAKAGITLSELMDVYFSEGCRNKKENTVRNELGFSNRHIKRLIGHKRVSVLRSTDIEKFMIDVAEGKSRTREKMGPRALAIVRGGKGAANRSRDLLSSALTFAVKSGYRPDNPAIGVKNYKLQPRERFLSQEEFNRLGQALNDALALGTNEHAIATIRVIALSGARSGEIIGLKRQWLEFAAGGVRLPDSKTGAKFLFLGVAATDIIKEHLDSHESEFVFPSADGDQPFGGLKKIWRQIRKLADLQDVRLHDLRHSFASVGVSSGASLYMVGKLLGHADAGSTKRYAHLADDPVCQAADEISSGIAEMMRAK